MPRTKLPAGQLRNSVAVGNRWGRAPAAHAPGRAPIHLVEGVPNPPAADGAGAGGHLTPSSGRVGPSGRPALDWWPGLISRSVMLAREVIGAVADLLADPLSLVGATPFGTGGYLEHPPAPRVQGAALPPIVLVPGFAASRTGWSALEGAMRAQGRTFLSFTYSPWASSVEELADRLTEAVEDLLAVTGAGKVHLVGHSLGGVIIAQALTRRLLAVHVDLVVTLGAPFGGTPWASLFPIGPLVWAMRPGSPLLSRLAAAPPPPSVRWLAFASTVDPIVPADRAVPTNRQVTRVGIDAGHSEMLRHPEVIARVAAAIAVRGAAAGTADLLAA